MGANTKAKNEVLSQVGFELAENFQPFQAGVIPDNSWTFHRAVRKVFQTNFSWGLVAYENHRELDLQIQATYAALDQALGELGGTGRAELWGLSKDRTAEEMVDLCERAAMLAGGESPQLIAPAPRPRIKGLLGDGKYRGAICSVIAEAAEARNVSFGVIVDELAPLGLAADATVLDHLELLPRTAPGPDVAEDAKSTAYWSGKWLGKRGNLMSDYFHAVRIRGVLWAELGALSSALASLDKKLKKQQSGHSLQM